MKNNNSDLIKQGVKEGGFPQHIYRFRQLDENFVGILEQSSMWFSNPSAFNDPFDCRANLEHNYPKQLVMDWLIRQGVEQSEAEHLYLSSKEAFKDIVSNYFEKIIADSMVCCFALQKENLLMWSHYTYGHTGVCLKFDITEDPEFFTFPIKVNYSKIYPKVNYIEDEKKAVDSTLTTKSKVWKYENEIRIIKPFEKQNRFSFKRTALKEIIFGCKTTDEKIREVKDLANKHGFKHLTYSRAVLNPQEYKLDFETV